jgi:hypothetical protein
VLCGGSKPRSVELPHVRAGVLFTDPTSLSSDSSTPCVKWLMAQVSVEMRTRRCVDPVSLGFVRNTSRDDDEHIP